MPEGYDFYALLDGENGPMIGNFYDDREQPDRLIVKVCTPAGLIDARLLGCKTLTLVAWPDRDPSSMPVPPVDLDEMVAQVLHPDDLANSPDGFLLDARRIYQEMSETRQAGLPIADMVEPLRTFPAWVYDTCVIMIDEEIAQRTAGKKVFQAQVMTNPFGGFNALIDEAIGGGAHE